MEGLNLNLQPYKITYEGSYKGVTFELEVFDGDWQIIWLFDNEADFEINDELEQAIYSEFLKLKNV